MDKQFTVEEIKTKVATNPAWAEHALVALFNRQTADEQQAEATVEKNHVGFNATDAEFLSSLAKQVIASRYPAGRKLSEKQLTYAFKRLPKYAGQLAKIAAQAA